jgi:hypothetical protein
MITSPTGLGLENDCAGEAQQNFQKGCYMRTITASVQLENKNSGRGSQGACCQDELIDGKRQVVK